MSLEKYSWGGGSIFLFLWGDWYHLNLLRKVLPNTTKWLQCQQRCCILQVPNSTYPPSCTFLLHREIHTYLLPYTYDIVLQLLHYQQSKIQPHYVHPIRLYTFISLTNMTIGFLSKHRSLARMLMFTQSWAFPAPKRDLCVIFESQVIAREYFPDFIERPTPKVTNT